MHLRNSALNSVLVAALYGVIPDHAAQGWDGLSQRESLWAGSRVLLKG